MYMSGFGISQGLTLLGGGGGGGKHGPILLFKKVIHMTYSTTKKNGMEMDSFATQVGSCLIILPAVMITLNTDLR